MALYAAFVRLKMKAMLEYRGAFFLQGICQAASYMAEFVVLWIVISQFQTINGWLPYEVLFLYALNLLSYSIAGSFVYSTAFQLPSMVQSGSFDEVLTKPMNPLLYMIGHRFAYQYASHIAVSIFILVLCYQRLDLTFTWVSACYLVLVVAGGAMIQASAFLYTSVPVFWMVQNQAISGFVFDLRGFIRYPISIYHAGVQVVLTLVLPYAFVNFYPAQYFLGKSDFLFFHPVFQYLTPVVGLVLLIGAYGFWQLGIRHYKSTGS
ncbi:ABC transporter permease [Paenibacillus hodogayensis]|uniref:ABC transporter permease n=1 Tax=Paenibacillus hodogayensis TaxID=279208 RepID=A0ABV5W3P6_9BACL